MFRKCRPLLLPQKELLWFFGPNIRETFWNEWKREYKIFRFFFCENWFLWKSFCENWPKTDHILSIKMTITRKIKIGETKNWFYIWFRTFHIFHVKLYFRIEDSSRDRLASTAYFAKPATLSLLLLLTTVKYKIDNNSKIKNRTKKELGVTKTPIITLCICFFIF